MMSMSDSKITKLPNSLIEMCVVVGMDDDTGLKYCRRSQANVSNAIVHFIIDNQGLSIDFEVAYHF